MPDFENAILHFLRFIRSCFGFFGEMNIHGFPLDWVFHLIGAFLLMLLLTKFISIKKSLWIVCFSMALKEVVDIFAKSRAEYIVPPSIDMPKDIIGGLAGIYFYFKYHQHLSKKKSTHNRNPAT